MKLSNRIMSWILSPGAYALWHSASNAEEWRWHRDHEYIEHKTNGVRVTVINSTDPSVPWLITVPLAFLFGTFVIDCEDPYRGAIGYFERHIIAGRVYRLRNRLRRLQDGPGFWKAFWENRRKKKELRLARNKAVFSKLTVNQ